MDKEQAVTYLRFSGFSDEQIKAIEGAFACPSAGVDCEDCPAYEKKPNINEVLDKIRDEISERSRMHMDGDLYIKTSDCMQIIDKYMAEGSGEE